MDVPVARQQTCARHGPYGVDMTEDEIIAAARARLPQDAMPHAAPDEVAEAESQLGFCLSCAASPDVRGGRQRLVGAGVRGQRADRRRTRRPRYGRCPLGTGRRAPAAPTRKTRHGPAGPRGSSPSVTGAVPSGRVSTATPRTGGSSASTRTRSATPSASRGAARGRTSAPVSPPSSRIGCRTGSRSSPSRRSRCAPHRRASPPNGGSDTPAPRTSGAGGETSAGMAGRRLVVSASS